MIVFHCMGTGRVQVLSRHECNIFPQPHVFFPGCLSAPSAPAPPSESPCPYACHCVLFTLLPCAEVTLEKALWSLHAHTTWMKSFWSFPHLNGFLWVPVASPEAQFDSDTFLPHGRACVREWLVSFLWLWFVCLPSDAIRNEAGQRLIEFCQENALVIANTLFQQHKRRLYT